MQPKDSGPKVLSQSVRKNADILENWFEQEVLGYNLIRQEPRQS